MPKNTNNQSKGSNLPTEKWQSAANKFVKRSEEILWSTEGAQAQKYLRSLGINQDTLRKYHVGYNPEVKFSPLGDWGLPKSCNSKGNLSKVWLPRGIVVPCRVGNAIRSIKIRQYLTKEQISNDEQPDCTIKGSMSGFFGAENLRGSLCAVLTDNEFDAMLLDQVAGDLVGAASFGRAVKGIRSENWVRWGSYLMSVAHILVLYHANEEEMGIIPDSHLIYSRRTHRANLPNVPGLQFVSDFKKLHLDPKEWVSQALSSFGILEEVTNHKLGISRPYGLDALETSIEVRVSEVSNHLVEKAFVGDVRPIRKSGILDFNEHRFVASSIRPTHLCHACFNDEYWQRPDGGWVCGICHPDPRTYPSNQARGRIC